MHCYKKKKHCYKKRKSDIYQKSNYATFYLTSPRFLYFSTVHSDSGLYMIIYLQLRFDDRWLAKTLTKMSIYWYSWHIWLISMHCSQKTFHFLSVSNDHTSVLPDIVITLRRSDEIIFVGYFWKTANACER